MQRKSRLDDQLEFVRKSFENGMSQMDVANALGEPYTVFRSWYVRRQHLLPKPRHWKKKQIDRETLRRMVEDEKLQQWKVAERLGVSHCLVQRLCTEYGIQTQRTGPRAGPEHTGWKGGVRMQKGYRYLWNPDHPNSGSHGYVAEHRLVMEKKLGRYLEKHEVVHHIDGQRLNNSPDNLQVFQTNAEHLRHELTGRCPEWTDEGKQRIRAGIAKSVQTRKSRARRNTRTSGHPSSSPGSTESPAISETEPQPQ